MSISTCLHPKSSEDYFDKIKMFKQDSREGYEGLYTFNIRIGVVDNCLEIKDTITTCKIVDVEEETRNSDDDYVPNFEKEDDSDTDSKKAQTYQQLVSFDPKKQTQITMGNQYQLI